MIKSDGKRTISNPAPRKRPRYFAVSWGYLVARFDTLKEALEYADNSRDPMLSVHDDEGEGEPLSWNDWEDREERREERERNEAAIRGQLAESESKFIERGERMTGLFPSDAPSELTDTED